MTASKAGETLHERKERQKRALRAELDDRRLALELCRKVRDDATANYADRLRTIELLQTMKAEQ